MMPDRNSKIQEGMIDKGRNKSVRNLNRYGSYKTRIIMSCVVREKMALI